MLNQIYTYIIAEMHSMCRTFHSTLFLSFFLTIYNWYCIDPSIPISFTLYFSFSSVIVCGIMQTFTLQWEKCEKREKEKNVEYLISDLANGFHFMTSDIQTWVYILNPLFVYCVAFDVYCARKCQESIFVECFI